MRDVRPLFFALIAIALAASLPEAQETAVAAIGGSALDAQGKPVPGGAVVIFPSDANAWSNPGPNAIQRASTDEGRFVFAGLAPGRYHVGVASADALADWPATSALSRLLNGAIPIAVTPGERVSLEIVIAREGEAVRQVSAKMMRTSTVTRRGGAPISGGVALPGGRRGGPPPPARPPGPGIVSGRITDADGHPVSGVEVRTMRWLTRDGSPTTLANFSSVGTTDADGRYRLTGRQPGEYLIVAAAYPLRTNTSTATESLMPPPSVASDGRQVGYVTTFFPGTRFAARATPVTIGAGERRDVDFTLDRVALFDVTGVMTGPSIMGASLTLRPVDVRDQVHIRWSTPDFDGTFTVKAVAAGRYELLVNSASGWARTPIEIHEAAPPPPLKLVLQPPFTVSGRVEFRGRETPPDAVQLKQMESFHVTIRPAVLIPGSTVPSTLIMPNGGFSLGVRGPGRYILQARTTAPWVQVAGIVNGQDTLDVPIEITGSVSDALVVIADRLTSVLGQVADERGQPATGGIAIVFPEDRRYWTMPSRRVQVLDVMPGGTFTASGLPPGRYRAIVRRDLRPAQPITPALLESLFENATSFELSEGQHRTLPLTVAGGQ